MAGLLRFFRPILEWLEARFAPAVVALAAADVQHAFFLAEPPQAPPAFDAAAADLVFSTGGLLPYLDDARVAPGLPAEGPAVPPVVPPAATVDAVFTLGLLPPAIPAAPAVTDSVFATGFTPTHALFDFTPPPPPKGLPPTPVGAGGSGVQPLELAGLPGPVDIDEMPGTADPDAVDPDAVDPDMDEADMNEADQPEVALAA